MGDRRGVRAQVLDLRLSVGSDPSERDRYFRAAPADLPELGRRAPDVFEVPHHWDFDGSDGALRTPTKSSAVGVFTPHRSLAPSTDMARLDYYMKYYMSVASEGRSSLTSHG